MEYFLRLVSSPSNPMNPRSAVTCTAPFAFPTYSSISFWVVCLIGMLASSARFLSDLTEPLLFKPSVSNLCFNYALFKVLVKSSPGTGWLYFSPVGSKIGGSSLAENTINCSNPTLIVRVWVSVPTSSAVKIELRIFLYLPPHPRFRTEKEVDSSSGRSALWLIEWSGSSS